MSQWVGKPDIDGNSVAATVTYWVMSPDPSSSLRIMKRAWSTGNLEVLRCT